MGRVPSRGMMLVYPNGVTRFDRRGEVGVFIESYRDKVRGLAAFPNGDYVISYAPYPNYPHSEYALHRFNPDGHHISSWHSVFGHDDWRIVGEFSGGPLAVTGEGDLLFSDAAQFRITKYLRGMPDSSHVILADARIVPNTAIQEAILPDGWLINWTRTLFVDEMEDGSILSVVREVLREGRRGSVRNLWIVAYPQDGIVARSRFDENYWWAPRKIHAGAVYRGQSEVTASLSCAIFR